MLLNLELTALQKYLNPNKAKLISKGVESVISRVMNLSEKVPNISHEMFSESLSKAFKEKWSNLKYNE
jgi:lipoate-protein ligase A